MLGVLLVLVGLCATPQDGSIIFLQDGFLVRPIERVTGSPLTHVAIILYESDGPYAFEATWPKVCRTPLKDYYAELTKRQLKNFYLKRGFIWTTIQPKKPYTPKQLESMKQYARSQLGRPYMMRGYWKNHEVKGIMCSQFVANCIEKSGRIKSANFKESPVSLKEKLKDLYDTLDPVSNR
jgi:hypothetical protein